MPRPVVTVLAAVAALVAATRGAAAQVPVQSVPLRDVRYTVTFTRDLAAARQFAVEMRATLGADGPVLLSLPTWTPGAYEVTNFARWVAGFGATAADGTPLRWDKLDPDTWRIRPAGAREIVVRFRYTATILDTSEAWATADGGFFNGTNLFPYPEGRPFDWPATVQVVTEPDWKVATGMEPAGAPRTFRAPTYHELVDAPVLVGALDVDSSTVAGKPFRIATYPAGSVAGAAREAMWAAVRRMVPPQAAVFGEVPWDHYTLLQVASETFEGGSGLEHANSHLDVVTAQAAGSPFLNSLYSHEIFHAWNVKRLRPRDLWPYRYDTWQPTPLLWISEGITDYYADLALLRGGVVDSAAFLAAVTEKMQEVQQAPPTSLEDASLSTWTKPQDGSGYLYYPKGALAGLALDIILRDATDNRASLDLVMRQGYEQAYKRGEGFTDAQWWGLVTKAGGAAATRLADFNARYVDQPGPYPWAEWLPLAGLRYAADTARDARLGISAANDSGAVRITAVEAGSAAARGGVQPGDVLLAIGDVTVADLTFGARFRARFAGQPAGTPVPVRVRRHGAVLDLTLALTYAERVTVRVTADPAAGPKARRVRDGLFRGTTGG